MTSTATTGRVALVGAGPGDAELITLKGARLLQTAEVVIYDNLVSQGILDLISPTAERIFVGKMAGNHTMPQDEICQLLVDKALEGKHVVRLKGGDPFVFGRGGAVVVLGLRFHVLDVQDFTLGVEKGDRQRQEGVAHPHAVTVFLREDKEHAFIGLHGTPMHQALHAVLLVGGDFGVDAVEAGGQIHPRHGRLRVRGRGEQRGQAERRKKMAHL